MIEILSAFAIRTTVHLSITVVIILVFLFDSVCDLDESSDGLMTINDRVKEATFAHRNPGGMYMMVTYDWLFMWVVCAVLIADNTVKADA